MPIPKPKPNEPRATFINRCMRTLTREDPNLTQKQRLAICFDKWRNRNKK